MANESFVKYIHAGPLDKEWGLYLTGAGYAQIPPALVYPPNVHPSGYYFTWEKGRILQEYQSITLPKDQAFLKLPTANFRLYLVQFLSFGQEFGTVISRPLNWME